jgi:hypothetical protein
VRVLYFSRKLYVQYDVERLPLLKKEGDTPWDITWIEEECPNLRRDFGLASFQVPTTSTYANQTRMRRFSTRSEKMRCLHNRGGIAIYRYANQSEL